MATELGLCITQLLPAPEPGPPPTDQAWLGHSRDDPGGALMFCPSDFNGKPFYVWTAANAPPPPVNREGLAREARATITLPALTPTFGPDAKRIAVNSWTWFSLTSAGPTTVTNTATDRGISVTVSARPVSTTWSPGEPADCPKGQPDQQCSVERQASFTCDGLGSLPDESVTTQTEPACGHKYSWMSTTPRTGGTKAWPVTAAVTWEFSWAATGTGPAVGPTTGTWREGPIAVAAAGVSVGEWRSELICGAACQEPQPTN